MRSVVLGVGNTLLSDEGVGVRVIEALADGYELPAEPSLVDERHRFLPGNRRL